MTNDTKRNAAIVATIDGMTLHLDFINGKRLSLNAGHVTSMEFEDIGQVDTIERAIMHGLKQKLVDAAAISRNPETGRAASIDDKYNAVKTVFNRLLRGQWNAVREGGGATGGLLLQALARIYDGRKTVEQLREYLSDKSDAEKTALRKNPKVAAIIDEIRVEMGRAGGIDTDELLNELEG